jgi:hypothetical protein
MHQLFQTTMLENIQAMGPAVSTTWTMKEAKLTKSKLRILRGCSGEDARSLFVLSKVYTKVDWEGHTRISTVGSCGNWWWPSLAVPTSAMCTSPQSWLRW